MTDQLTKEQVTAAAWELHEYLIGHIPELDDRFIPTNMILMGKMQDVSAIQRVRCPYGYVRGPDSTQVWVGHEGPGSDECGHCDGRGWLYPDPPEAERLWLPESWEVFCQDVWRILGMYEFGEGQ